MAMTKKTILAVALGFILLLSLVVIVAGLWLPSLSNDNPNDTPTPSATPTSTPIPTQTPSPTQHPSPKPTVEETPIPTRIPTINDEHLDIPTSFTSNDTYWTISIHLLGNGANMSMITITMIYLNGIPYNSSDYPNVAQNGLIGSVDNPTSYYIYGAREPITTYGKSGYLFLPKTNDWKMYDPIDIGFETLNGNVFSINQYLFHFYYQG
jgi:hypothetical protein